MKRIIALFIVVWLLLMAYVSALAPRPASMPDDARPTPRIPNHVYYTKRCWPACHYDPSTVKPPPQPDTYGFDGSLGDGWRWLHEERSRWSLTERPGVLRLLPHGGTLSTAVNQLVREAPNGHFDLIARVSLPATVVEEEAAVLILSDDDRPLSVSRGYRDGTAGVYFDGTAFGCRAEGVPVAAETLHLMLRRAGNSYIGYYRLAEGDWVEVGRCYAPSPEPAAVGLAACGEPEAGPVDFDSFTIVARR